MYDTGWTYVWQSVCCWSFIIWNVHVSVWKFIERIYKYTYCAYITYVFSQRIHFYTYIYTHPQDTMQVPTPWKVQLPGCPTALELGVKASSPGAGRLAGFPAKLPKKKETCQALQNTIKENIQVGPHFFWVFYLKKKQEGALIPCGLYQALWNDESSVTMLKLYKCLPFSTLRQSQLCTNDSGKKSESPLLQSLSGFRA